MGFELGDHVLLIGKYPARLPTSEPGLSGDVRNDVKLGDLVCSQQVRVPALGVGTG